MYEDNILLRQSARAYVGNYPISDVGSRLLGIEKITGLKGSQVRWALWLPAQVTDVFNRRVQPRSDSESSKVSTQGAAPPEVAATDAAQELEQPANQVRPSCHWSMLKQQH